MRFCGTKCHVECHIAQVHAFLPHSFPKTAGAGRNGALWRHYTTVPRAIT